MPTTIPVRPIAAPAPPSLGLIMLPLIPVLSLILALLLERERGRSIAHFARLIARQAQAMM